MHLSAIERKILNCLQEDIPLSPAPFKILSKKIGIKEKELLKKIKELKERGIIRSFASSLNHRALGFKSTLLALRVPPDKVEDIATELIKYTEVTHCYVREGEFNLWTVFLYKDGMIKNVIKKITKQIGKENILNLKTIKQFKLKTRFKI